VSSDVSVELTLSGAVCRITLTRAARRNALTRAMLAELRRVISAIDPAVRVVVLQAEGPVFCAGMDLGEMQAAAAAPDATAVWRQDAQLYREVCEALWSLPMPTLAVVQGPVVAGGVGLVCACDIVLASAKATFALPEPQRGLTAAIVTPFLVRRVGEAAAGSLLLSGRTWMATRALRRGLCDEVTYPERLETAADDLLQSILAGGPQAFATTKRNLRAWSQRPLSEALDAAVEESARLRGEAEAQEGLRAFLEKRTPGWAPERS
jgi:methylglutaconyl-CoA hydratase